MTRGSTGSSSLIVNGNLELIPSAVFYCDAVPESKIVASQGMKAKHLR
jgi:hypothetical protein